MFEDTMRQWNPWWAEKRVPEDFLGIRRDVTDSIINTLSTRHIKDVIGVRRSGKTTVLYQVAEHLINTGVSPYKFPLII